MDLVESINLHIRGVIQGLSSKKIPRPDKRSRLTIEPGEKADQDMPDVNTVISALSGTGNTVVQRA